MGKREVGDGERSVATTDYLASSKEQAPFTWQTGVIRPRQITRPAAALFKSARGARAAAPGGRARSPGPGAAAPFARWASPVVPLEDGALSAPKLQAQNAVEGDRGGCAAEVGWHRDNPSRGKGHQSRVSSPFALFVHEAFQRVCGTPAFNSCAIQAIVWTLPCVLEMLREEALDVG